MTTPKNNPENEFHAPRELAEGLARLHVALDTLRDDPATRRYFGK